MSIPALAIRTPLSLFRQGFDTARIASILRITEAQALRRLNRERSAELGLPDPY